MGWFGATSSGLSGSSTAEDVTLDIQGAGLTAIITGASSGIGAETARVLALRGVHVVMAVRNISSGSKVKDQILWEIPSAQVDVMELDLSSMASVRIFAADFMSSNQPLNILINNAAVLPSTFSLSEDNIELQFATNYLGHFLLTHLLLDNMKNTARESGREGRIVNVSSAGHWLTYSTGIRFDKLNDPSRYVTFRAYGQSKLANILHANELARRLKNDGAEITANSVHPGAVNTNFFRHESMLLGMARMFAKYIFKGVGHGAATVCYVALHPRVNGVSGEYFSNCNVAKPSRQARDVTLATKLWDFSTDLIQ